MSIAMVRDIVNSFATSSRYSNLFNISIEAYAYYSIIARRRTNPQSEHSRKKAYFAEEAPSWPEKIWFLLYNTPDKSRNVRQS